MAYDVQSMIGQSKEAARIANMTMQGEIVPWSATEQVHETTAKAVYGDTAKDPDHPTYQFRVKVTSPPEVAGTTFTEAFSAPSGPASWLNTKFKMAMYNKRYGKLPEVGDKVTIVTNADNFYRILL